MRWITLLLLFLSAHLNAACFSLIDGKTGEEVASIGSILEGEGFLYTGEIEEEGRIYHYALWDDAEHCEEECLEIVRSLMAIWEIDDLILFPIAQARPLRR